MTSSAVRHSPMIVVLAVVCTVAALLGGCATSPLPAPARGVELSVEQARRALPAEPVPVRWGGTLAAVRNTADGKTVLEVVSRPLARDGRPIRNDVTEGRFLAVVDAFLDPEIIRTGRDVTVIGAVGERRDGRIGESDYVFPVVAVEDYHYWKPRPPSVPVHFPHPYPLGGDHHDDFWHGWPYYHPRRHRRGSGVSMFGSFGF